MVRRVRRSISRSVQIRLRWLRRRAESRAPRWVRAVLPWGTSLMAHVAVVMILAVVVVIGNVRDEPDDGVQLATQLVEDLTTLSPSDRSGDPFTTLDSLEAPSLARERDLTVSRLSELPDVSYEDRMQLDPALKHSVSEVGLAMLPRIEAPFSGRSREQRAKLVRREGGSVESEKAVERGLDWIVRHQKPDGSWSLDTSGECSKKHACPKRAAMDSDTAATGLALLPLLGAGHSHTEPGRYQANVRRGLEWLVGHQKPDGDLFVGGKGNVHMYSHAIATIAISEAYGLTGDRKLKSATEKAIGFIAKAQNPKGGWRYNPGQAGDTSVFGWQVMALRSAQLAELSVPDGTIRDSLRYLDRASVDERGVTYSYQPGSKATPVMTAEALLIREYMGWDRHNKALVAGAEEVARNLFRSKERNIYYWYYATQMLHNLHNRDWRRWNVMVRDGLVAMQVKGESCDRGSWDPDKPLRDRWGHRAGRLFTTSLSLLSLEVYYRCLPLYGTTEGR